MCQAQEAKKQPASWAEGIVNRVHDQFAASIYSQIHPPSPAADPSVFDSQPRKNTLVLQACDLTQHEISLKSSSDGVNSFLHRLAHAFLGGGLVPKLEEEEQESPQRSLDALKLCEYVCERVTYDASVQNELVKDVYSKQARTKYEIVAEFKDITQTPILLGANGMGSDFALGRVPGE